MIRRMTLEDMAAVVGIIIEAHGHMGYDKTAPAAPDVDSVVILLLDAMVNPKAALFVVDIDGEVIGACGIGITPSPWNRSVLVATEVYWHMRTDQYGLTGRKWFLRMLEAMKSWAKEMGAHWFNCVTPPGVSGNHLERHGFTLVENTYGKVL